MLYRALRTFLFLFDPEAIHHATFSVLRVLGKIPGWNRLNRLIFVDHHPHNEKELFGLKFPNRVGLAAGFDKNALIVDELAAFGFGFIEIGTVTPIAQAGNEKPRLFRLPADEALINRMGFNNDGAAAVAARLKKRRASVIIGGNVGKNKATANEDAVEDYRRCVDELYPWVDYFVVNVSSPNTPGLRDLQEKEPLRILLTEIKRLASSRDIPRPVLLKIAPDLRDEQLDDIIGILRETNTDGIIATNTTLSREELRTPARNVASLGAGGLSGRPLKARSTAVIAYLRQALGPDFPIIGVGGIMNPQDALEKINAGADLVQIYTGFIYQGPGFAKRICRFLTGKI